jgi:hypothetical protein
MASAGADVFVTQFRERYGPDAAAIASNMTVPQLIKFFGDRDFRTIHGTKGAFITALTSAPITRNAGIPSMSSIGMDMGMGGAGGGSSGMQLVGAPAVAMGGMSMGGSGRAAAGGIPGFGGGFGGGGGAAGSSASTAFGGGGGGGAAAALLEDDRSIRVTGSDAPIVDPTTHPDTYTRLEQVQTVTATTSIVLYTGSGAPRETVPAINATSVREAARAAAGAPAIDNENGIDNNAALRAIFIALATPAVAGWKLGSYAILRLFKYIDAKIEEKNKREAAAIPRTLLDGIRKGIINTRADVKYNHDLLEAIRGQVHLDPSKRDITDVGVLNVALSALEAGEAVTTAAFELMNAYNNLMKETPLPTPETDGGASIIATGMDMTPVTLHAFKCDLLRRYMIFVYYARLKATIRAEFTEEWSTMESNIRGLFERNKGNPQGFLSSLVGYIRSIWNTNPALPRRSVSYYTAQGKKLESLISRNEIYLINGLINLFVETVGSCSKITTLKQDFKTYLTNVEMDIPQIIAGGTTTIDGIAYTFEQYVKGVLEQVAKKSSAANTRGIGVGMRGPGGSVRTMFNTAGARTAAAAKAAAAAAAAEEARAVNAMPGGPSLHLGAEAAGQWVGTALAAPAIGAQALGTGLRTVAGAVGSGMSTAAETAAAAGRGFGAGVQPIANAFRTAASGAGQVALGTAAALGYDSYGHLISPTMFGEPTRSPSINPNQQYREMLAAQQAAAAQRTGGGGGGGAAMPAAASTGAGSAFVLGRPTNTSGYSKEERKAYNAGKKKQNAEAERRREERARVLYQRRAAGAPVVGTGPLSAVPRPELGNSDNSDNSYNEITNNQGGGYRHTRRAAKRHSRRHRIVHRKKTRVNRKRVTRRH